MGKLTWQTVVMRTRIQFGKRAFSICGRSIWNQIPPHTRNLHSVPAFRKALKSYLFSEITYGDRNALSVSLL